MKLVKLNLPPEVIEYKDRHVWPLKTEYEALARQGGVDQVKVRARLIPTLRRYVSFLAGFEATTEFGRELAWAEGEIATLTRMETSNLIRVPVRQGGRKIRPGEGEGEGD